MTYLYPLMPLFDHTPLVYSLENIAFQGGDVRIRVNRHLLSVTLELVAWHSPISNGIYLTSSLFALSQARHFHRGRVATSCSKHMESSPELEQQPGTRKCPSGKTCWPSRKPFARYQLFPCQRHIVDARQLLSSSYACCRVERSGGNLDMDERADVLQMIRTGASTF